MRCCYLAKAQSTPTSECHSFAVQSQDAGSQEFRKGFLGSLPGVNHDGLPRNKGLDVCLADFVFNLRRDGR
jgi:hypothetical protein